MWIPRPKGYHEMFIGGSLDLNSPARPDVVARATRAAWLRLRFDVPELAVTAGYGEDGNAYMQYEGPKCEAEGLDWAERTSFVECRRQPLIFDEMLEIMRQKKQRHESEQAFLFLSLVVQDNSELVRRVDFILNADHQITDGIGIKILLGRFLDLLVQSLSESFASWERLDWRNSAINLSPPWICVMNDEQNISGPEYEKVADANEEILFQRMVIEKSIIVLNSACIVKDCKGASRKVEVGQVHFASLDMIDSRKWR